MLNQIDPFDIRTFPSFPNLKKHFLSYLPENAFKEGQEDCCWNWQGARKISGYGQINWGGQPYRANRLSYIIFNSAIPYNKIVRHTCDNPNCVNPNHLILGTNQDNSIDMVKRNRQRNQKLTQEKVVEIKNTLKKPYLGICRDLAEKYNVSQSTISMIKTNRIWKWLTI